MLKLHDRAHRAADLTGESIEAWLEWDPEADSFGVPVEIGGEDLSELVEHSTVLIPREDHRRSHETDFVRWGRRGGLETFRRYGSAWYAALALRRWGRLSAEALEAARPVRPVG